VQMPDGLNARGLRLLVAGTTPEIRQTDGWLAVTVPPFAAHEVIAIDV